jgi:hypothetical protein
MEQHWLICTRGRESLRAALETCGKSGTAKLKEGQPLVQRSELFWMPVSSVGESFAVEECLET